MVHYIFGMKVHLQVSVITLPLTTPGQQKVTMAMVISLIVLHWGRDFSSRVKTQALLR